MAEEVDFSTIDATAMNTDALKAAVTRALVAGETSITVTLAADAPVEMFTAIRRAICDTEGVADGSINLTLKGVTAIPNSSEDDPIFAESYINGSYENVTQLASVNLPHVQTIGEYAFYGCGSLSSLYAPMVKTIEVEAFRGTGLTFLELSQATTIANGAFTACTALTTVKLPKANYIGDFAFESCEKLTKLELTAEDEIFFSIAEGYNEEFTNVDLVLHKNKENLVTNGVNWKSVTFKSITFVGE